MVDIKRGGEWAGIESRSAGQPVSITAAAERKLRSAISGTGIRSGNGVASSAYNPETDPRLAHTRIRRTDIDPAADPKFTGNRFPGYGRI